MVDVAQEAHLALAPLFGQGDRDLHLGGVETDKNGAILLHGSSPLREARCRTIRRNPRSPHSAGRATSASATNIRSVIRPPAAPCRGTTSTRISQRWRADRPG